MGRAQRKARPDDPLWEQIRSEVTEDARREPVLAPFLESAVLDHARLEHALAQLLATSLATESLGAQPLRKLFDEAFAADPSIGAAVRADLRAVRERDPACSALSAPLLYFKGFHALQAWRVGHWLFARERRALAFWLQNRISEVFGADIHPAARIGRGVLIDHGTGVVIGETAVIEDDVSLLHEVTLGGTGKQSGDRHPKIRAGVLIGAGAKLLGNVVVGEGAKIGAGSVVLADVPAHSTVAGVPARVVGREQVQKPALEMDHRLPTDWGDG